VSGLADRYAGIGWMSFTLISAWKKPLTDADATDWPQIRVDPSHPRNQWLLLSTLSQDRLDRRNPGPRAQGEKP
jgi:hypothetical protein